MICRELDDDRPAPEESGCADALALDVHPGREAEHENAVGGRSIGEHVRSEIVRGLRVVLRDAFEPREVCRTIDLSCRVAQVESNVVDELRKPTKAKPKDARRLDANPPETGGQRE